MRATIEQHLTELRQRHDDALTEFNALHADINALKGAIQFGETLLASLPLDPPVSETKE